MAIYLKRVKGEGSCKNCYFFSKPCPQKAIDSCTKDNNDYILIQIEKPEEKQ